MRTNQRINRAAVGIKDSAIKIRKTRNHITITVYGKKDDYPVVAGIALSPSECDLLLKRLSNVRASFGKDL